MALGQNHTCAIAGTAAVCWGSNAAGQLGQPGTGRRPRMRAVAALSGVVDLAAGKQHTCALLDAGEVHCWGTLHYRDGWQIELDPHVPLPLREVVDIVAGAHHACALVRSGDVYCWGANGFGQLGDGSTKHRARPERVVGLSRVRRLFAGGEATCAVQPVAESRSRRKSKARPGVIPRRDAEYVEEVLCWGNPRAEAMNPEEAWLIPTPRPELLGARRIAISHFGLCAQRASGEVACTMTMRTEPEGSGLATLTDARDISAGYGDLGVLRDHGVVTVFRSTELVPHQSPVAIEDALELVLGPFDACYRRRDGRVLCWNPRGGNGAAELGDTTSSQRRGLVPVVGLETFESASPPGMPRPPEPGLEIREVAAGGCHTCLSFTDGRAACLGCNDAYQLGHRLPGDQYEPMLVPGLEGVKQLASTNEATCALDTVGRVQCFGRGSEWLPGTLEPVPELAGVTALAGDVAGHEGLLCALRRTADAVCYSPQRGYCLRPVAAHDLRQLLPWPSGVFTLDAAGHFAHRQLRSGECSYGHTSTRWDRPDCADCLEARVLGAWARLDAADGSIGRVTSMAVADTVLCALGERGRVRCWDTVDETAHAIDLDGVTQLVAGGHHFCVLAQGGQVFCFGRNTYAERGSDAPLPQFEPNGVAGLHGISGLTAGYAHTCAWSRHAVHCFGLNAQGQAGGGMTAFKTAPTRVGDLTGVVAVAAGYAHTCAVDDAGRVRCFGDGWSDGTERRRLTPAPVPLGAVEQIAAGREHSCAVLRGGRVACWGSNAEAQLGLRTLVTQPEEDFEGPPPFVQPVAPHLLTLRHQSVTVAAGIDFSCALDRAGQVTCWTFFEQFSPRGPSGIQQLRAADREICLLTRAGQIWCGPPLDPLQRIEGLPEAVSLDTSGSHGCALTKGGKVVCWGSNASLQRGNPDPSLRPRAREVSGLDDVVKVVTGGRWKDHRPGGTGLGHTCALHRTGRVSCFGDNEHGQLGDGTRQRRHEPREVPGLSDVIDIDAGATHTCAVKRDGSLYCFGNNWEGQLGLGFANYVVAPQLVYGTAD